MSGFPHSLKQVSAPVIQDVLRTAEGERGCALFLAPMSGVTDQSFRRLIKLNNPGAVSLVTTELVSVEGITRSNLQSFRMLDFTEDERPIAIQIFGYDINRMVEGARIAQARGADMLDVNCGCPVPKVVRRGAGCGLMREPGHFARMLREIRQAVSIPVTVKIRAGWDRTSRNALEIARIAEDEGAAWVTVHGRTREEGYRGAADWMLIAEVARSLSIPVIGSGDVVDGPSAAERLNSGAAALMIGRAALLNPWVFRTIKDYFAGKEAAAQDRADRVAVAGILQTYMSMLSERLPERAILGRLKQFASRVTRLVPESAAVRKALCRSHDVAQFVSILDLWAYDALEGPAR